MSSVTLQGRNAQAITPNDSNDISLGGGLIDSSLETGAVLFVGTGGNIQVTTIGGQTVTFLNIADGTFIPVQVRRVWATSTTASNILAIY